MKRLIELANKIQDKKLRDKTVKLLQEPEISNSEISYPAEKFEEIPAWVGAHHNYKGGQLEHTISVVNICLNEKRKGLGSHRNNFRPCRLFCM
jgi:hypothetical protein